MFVWFLQHTSVCSSDKKKKILPLAALIWVQLPQLRHHWYSGGHTCQHDCKREMQFCMQQHSFVRNVRKPTQNWWTHSITGYVGGHTDQRHDYYMLVANLFMIFLISITHYWNRMSMCLCMWWYHDLTVVPLRFPIKYTAPSNFRWVKLPFWLTPIRPGQAKRALQAFLAKDSGVTVMTSRWRVWKPEGHTKETEISPSDRQGYMTLRVQLSKCCCCLSVVLSFSLAHSLTISF